jgi:FAD dependent oxidoreductase
LPGSWSRDTANTPQAQRCGASSRRWSAIADSLPYPGSCLKSSSGASESLRHSEFLPISDGPFWFRAGHPLANYQSTPTLPPSVDVLIIGAGLTGASAAYHLGLAMRDRRLHVAVIDRGDPATKGDATAATSSCFPRIPSACTRVWRASDLNFSCTSTLLPIEVLRAESERQASLVVGMAPSQPRSTSADHQ